MKKILNIVIILLLLNSCESRIDHEYDGGWYVAFEKATIKDKESTDQIKIPVILADNGRKDQVTVDFQLEPADGVTEGTDFELLNESNTLTFEPGVGIQYIIIKPIDNLNPENNKSIQISITSNSKNLPIGFTGPDALNSSCEVIIMDDDCPLVKGVFDGKVTGDETPLGQTWWGTVYNEQIWQWDFIQEVSPGVVEYNVTGFWASQLDYWVGENGIAPGTLYPVKVTIDMSNPASPKYSIEEALCASCEYGDYYTQEVDNQPLPVIDVCSKYIEIPYTLNSGWPSSYVFNVKFQF